MAITGQPAAVSINSGGTATLTVTASGTAPLTYYWYQGPSGTTTTPVGTNSSSFTTPALTSTTSYWVKVTNAVNSAGADSNTATVTVNPSGGPTPGMALEQPAGSALASGATRSFPTLAVGRKATLSFTVRNTAAATGGGSAPNLTISSAVLSGPNAAEFHVLGSLSAPIKPGKSKTFKVQFAPTNAGSKSAVLTITTNVPGASPFVVTLLGGPPISPVAQVGTAAGPATAATALVVRAATAKAAATAVAASSAPVSPPVAPSPVDLNGTTWSVPMTSRVNIEGAGEEDGQGTLRLTFDADGTLWLEDDSGFGMSGTWSSDDQGELVAEILPQSVEDYVRAVFGAGPDLGVAVDPANLNIWLTAEPGGPVMNVTLDFAASLTGGNPGAAGTVTRKLTCEIDAAGPRK